MTGGFRTLSLSRPRWPERWWRQCERLIQVPPRAGTKGTTESCQLVCRVRYLKFSMGHCQDSLRESPQGFRKSDCPAGRFGSKLNLPDTYVGRLRPSRSPFAHPWGGRCLREQHEGTEQDDSGADRFRSVRRNLRLSRCRSRKAPVAIP